MKVQGHEQLGDAAHRADHGERDGSREHARVPGRGGRHLPDRAGGGADRPGRRRLTGKARGRDRRDRADDQERRRQADPLSGEPAEARSRGEAGGGARGDGSERGASRTGIGGGEPRRGGRPHDPVCQTERQPTDDERGNAQQRLRRGTGGEQHRRSDRDALGAEPVRDHPGRCRDGERGQTGGGDQEPTHGTAEVVKPGQRREQRDDRALRRRGDEQNGVDDDGERSGLAHVGLNVHA